MNVDPLETVIRHLRDGDFASAEEAYAAYEPYLRAVVRRRLPQPLRRRVDSTDIVQSVWADLIEGFRERRWDFADERLLRAFLVRAACNRVVDRYRQHHASVEKEQPISDAAGQMADSGFSSPSEIAQSDELWRQMLDLCPEEHHEILRLRREGHSLVEIAGRTGLHEGSVRRILRKLARELASRRGASEPIRKPP